MAWLFLCTVVTIGASDVSPVGQGRAAIGTLEVSSAELGAEKGILRFGALGEYFRQKPFPVPPAENLRTAGTLALSYVPVSFLEVFASYAATSNINSTSAPRLIQALGDVSLGLKWAHKGPHGLFGGLQLTGHTYPGVGTQDVRQMALGATPLLLFSWNLNALTRFLPFRWHLNVGSHFNNTPRLVEGVSLNAAEEFALNIQRYPRFLAQTALEMNWGPVTPFVEYKMAYPLWVPGGTLTAPDGSDLAVTRAFPHSVIVGAKAHLLRGVALLGAADFGLRREVARGVPATPAWNVLLGAQFALLPPAAPASAPPSEAVQKPLIEGLVLDSREKTPLENAVVTFEAGESFKVATTVRGHFQSPPLRQGLWKISVEKPGYEPQQRSLELSVGTPPPLTFLLVPLEKKTTFLITVQANNAPLAAKVTFVGDEPFVFRVPARREPTRVALPPGRYQVEVSADGMASQSRDIQSAESTAMPLLFDLKPAPRPEPQWVVVTEKKIETLQAVHFETGTAKIHTDSLLLLQAVVQAILKNDIKKLRIEGHTDNQGGKARNMKLSLARAQAVARYLVEFGVDSSRLETVGMGDTRPIAPNLTARSRELNRRVEFVILKR